MRSNGILLALLVLFAPVSLAGPVIERWETSHKVPVLFVAAPTIPMFVARVILDAGSARDGAQPGLATVVSALLGEGTRALTTDEFHARMEMTGAALGSGLVEDYAWFSLRSLTDRRYADPALALAAEALAAPRFDPEDFRLVQRQLRTSLDQLKSSPGARADRTLHEMLFPGHPYAGPAEGTEQSLAALTREDVVRFHARFHVAANARVILVGALTREEAGRIAETLIADLPLGEKAPAIPPVPTPAAAQRHIRFDSAQTHLLFAQPGITRRDPDYFPLMVGNHVLGGNAVSVLFQEIREKRGLSYAVSSDFLPMAQAGPWVVRMQTDAVRAAEARAVLRELLARYVRDGPDASAVAAARDNLVGGFPLRIDTNSKVADYLTLIAFYDLPLDWLDRVPAELAKVTPAQVKEAFARRIRPGMMQEISVGPTAPEP